MKPTVETSCLSHRFSRSQKRKHRRLHRVVEKPTPSVTSQSAKGPSETIWDANLDALFERLFAMTERYIQCQY